jgi:putative acyl-CoA dehydrogenase
VGEKAGVTCGMALTEKQGGSDVRANTTRAEATGGGDYALTGHKWFCSAPMCDLFLVLAQAPEGLSCFLLPRVLPDGSRNALRIQRLKDKLGNRSNASAEVEYEGAFAWLVGEPGRGVATIIEMVTATRLDCVLGSAAQLRQACVSAAHYAGLRQAFGAALIDHPAMTSVIADLTLESEAGAVLAMRLAGAADRAARGDRGEADFLRLALPAAKFWVCKRTPMAVGEALDTSRTAACPGCTGTHRSTRSGRARATSPRWTCCGPCTGLPARRTPCSRRSTRRQEPTGGWTRPSGRCVASWRRPPVTRASWPAAWPGWSRWSCRRRC